MPTEEEWYATKKQLEHDMVNAAETEIHGCALTPGHTINP
jgi:hypothetical protein